MDILSGVSDLFFLIRDGIIDSLYHLYDFLGIMDYPSDEEKETAEQMYNQVTDPQWLATEGAARLAAELQ
jgi:hypothetical protein